MPNNDNIHKNQHAGSHFAHKDGKKPDSGRKGNGSFSGRRFSGKTADKRDGSHQSFGQMDSKDRMAGHRDGKGTPVKPGNDDKREEKRSFHPAESAQRRRPDRQPRGKSPVPSRTDGNNRHRDKSSHPGENAGLAARRVALDTLLDVSLRDAYAQLALEERLKQARLDARDTAFVTRLVYGTIENRLTLDYRIDQTLEEQGELDPTIREILRMGAYQLFYMDRVPDMAATDMSVRLVRSMKMEGLTGLVNGVLRNMTREKDNIAWPTPEENPVRYLSIMYSAPMDLCRMLIERYGEQMTREILSFRHSQPYESVRPNLLRCDDARFRRLMADADYTFEPGLVEGTYRVYNPGDLTRMRAHQNGLFVIQGESSVLAARAVCARPGQTILDACAAPGGKTALISEMMQDTGRVYAWDIHPHRVELIRETMIRLHLENIRPAIRDAQVPRPEMADTLDAALIDAPCSGSGVFGNKPDLKYRISQEAVDALIRVQAAILDSVADMVKPGGLLVYSTCSIFPDENENQVTAFLSNHPEYKVLPLGDILPESVRSLEGQHGVQFIPHKDNLDGFYICRMQKVR